MEAVKCDAMFESGEGEISCVVLSVEDPPLLTRQSPCMARAFCRGINPPALFNEKHFVALEGEKRDRESISYMICSHKGTIPCSTKDAPTAYARPTLHA